MANNDNVGAQSFLEHAHKIYEEKLKQIMDGESKELRIDELWIPLYKNGLPTDQLAKKEFSEKILTLSSMIFLRSTQNMPVLPHQSTIAQETHAVVSIKH